MVNYLAAGTSRSAPSLPLKSGLELHQVTKYTWELCSDALGAMIGDALGPSQNAGEVGPWLEDAIRILLSPSSHPLTAQATKALASLCVQNALYQRFSDCMRSLASPDSEYCIQVLSRLREICSAMDDTAAQWLLGEILHTSPCVEQCTHGPSPSLALLLYHHAPRHERWTKCCTSILVERCRTILTTHGTWLPSATSSFCILLSLPDTYNSGDPDVSKVLLDVVRSPTSSARSLRPLVSIHPADRADVVLEAATRCIVSLISNADTQGVYPRFLFLEIY